jgi:hypothetical protein
MAERDYDVSCPLGYGNLRFVGTGRCPVSGKESCASCDVKPYDSEAKDPHVRRETKNL